MVWSARRWRSRRRAPRASFRRYPTPRRCPARTCGGSSFCLTGPAGPLGPISGVSPVSPVEPDEPGPYPVVIIAPGSLGLQEHHLSYAAELTDAAIAACAIDPFGNRGVVSTVENQAQYSFAASAWDVLAAAELLAARPEIDAARVGAQGHSRGGSAVLSAASVHLAAASNAPKLVGVYAAYPWSGHQFVDPAVGGTRVRAIIGDLDDWCSPTQVQAHVHAMRVGGGDATVRIVGGARHSFDRTTPLEHIPDAAVAPAAPTLYISDDGAFILPTSDEPDPELVDLDGFLYAFEAGYAVRGAHIGGSPELAPLFVEDMMAFWIDVMGAVPALNDQPCADEGASGLNLPEDRRRVIDIDRAGRHRQDGHHHRRASAEQFGDACWGGPVMLLLMSHLPSTVTCHVLEHPRDHSRLAASDRRAGRSRACACRNCVVRVGAALRGG